MVNKLRGVVNAVAIKAPGFGERRKALLQVHPLSSYTPAAHAHLVAEGAEGAFS